jgi:hypothetical protein
MDTVFWFESLKGREHPRELEADGRIILEWILGKQIGNIWTGFFWLGIKTSGKLL